MKKSILEFWVGVFVLLGLGALGVLSFRVAGGQGWLGKKQQEYVLYAEFSNIGGLKVNAPIRAAGVLVGRVDNITLDPESYQAKVTLKVNNQYKFSSDATAQILTSGLLGEQYIGLIQGGDSEQLNAGDTIVDTNSAVVLENLISSFMGSFMNNKEKSSESHSEGKAAP